ncbi:MAG TPA: methylated-DNA--[protein]-cysteine S-methyltransferase [Gammaproteobacteria bacterium]|nr:methylated-DNA--[protein]-cysteine S-methyltransferase [Gammaproteobacteria bacterium]
MSTKNSLLSNLTGTDFQKRVWAELLKISPGKTVTYSELAKKLNSHPRAIGQACRANPLPIIIPCHRVVGKNNLGGYFGHTHGKLLDKKKRLLALEKTTVRNKT